MTPLSPESKVYDWSKARYDLYCDYCGYRNIGVIVGTSESICANCADASELQDWKNYAKALEDECKKYNAETEAHLQDYMQDQINYYKEELVRSFGKKEKNGEVLYLLRENKDLRDKLSKYEKFILAVAKGIDILQENGGK